MSQAERALAATHALNRSRLALDQLWLSVRPLVSDTSLLDALVFDTVAALDMVADHLERVVEAELHGAPADPSRINEVGGRES